MRVRLPLLSVVFCSLFALTACGGGSVSPPPPLPQQTQLTVTLAGSGNVTSSPSGINCPTTCTANFSSETTVTLTATPAIGFNFSGFSGACSGMTCQLTVSSGQNVTVSATFVQSSSQDITSINHIIVMLQENRSFAPVGVHREPQPIMERKPC